LTSIRNRRSIQAHQTEAGKGDGELAEDWEKANKPRRKALQKRVGELNVEISDLMNEKPCNQEKIHRLRNEREEIQAKLKSLPRGAIRNLEQAYRELDAAKEAASGRR